MSPTPLWTPSADVIANANLTQLRLWLNENYALDLSDYDALWRWSTTEIGLFWQALWGYLGIVASVSADTPLDTAKMPGASWFPGARLNYAENIFAKATDERPALLYADETGTVQPVSWATLTAQTAQLRAALIAAGVTEGDRVVAYLPNIVEAVAGVLATASLGAIWSSCSPDFGVRSVLDRFSQIEPKVLLTVDGYQYNGKPYPRLDVVAQLQAALPSLEQTILVPLLGEPAGGIDHITWDDALAAHPDATMEYAQLPFDHPLWILYSSGTTGLPKPIVHGHGGNLLEHAKATIFHNDLKPTDRFFWFTSTGWMMWNYSVGALLSGATVVLYNGSPSFPDLMSVWRLLEAAGVTYWGTSPAFVSACMKADLNPSDELDLSAIRGVGSTGAPLPDEAFAWLYANIHANFALESLSGGTDLCTAFVGGARTKPVYAGEIQGASLGAKVEAYSANGQPVVGEVGELVITAPMPSMPLRFWNDANGERFFKSYFDFFPNVWRHGDWIAFNERGGCVIYGRSDATINRKGVRMGTAEIYSCVEALDVVLDSLVIDLEGLGGQSYMPLFVILRPGVALDDGLVKQIKQTMRQELSPRHVPDEIFQVDAIPYTLSGKKLEIPVRRILLGEPVETAANLGAMRNPESVAYFVALVETGRLPSA